MRPIKRMQWTGVVVAAAGAVLMGYSGSLSRSGMGAQLLMGPPPHVDWLLLVGMVVVVGGGLLVQSTWVTSMGDERAPNSAGEAETDLLLRREAVRRSASPGLEVHRSRWKQRSPASPRR